MAGFLFQIALPPHRLVDMKANNVDILISAPQKGWSVSPSAGPVMLGERALENHRHDKQFICLRPEEMAEIMRAYENGGHAHHATMPTDGWWKFRDVMLETQELGFDKLKQQQVESAGVSAPAGGARLQVCCCRRFPGARRRGQLYRRSRHPERQEIPRRRPSDCSRSAPSCDEGPDYRSFRVSACLALDKLANIERTVENFRKALDKVG
ncbi:MAG: hypothetical protein R3D34_14115 [Nitratireductor sp.]